MVWTPPGIAAALVWTGIFLVVGIWLSTALLQVPRHTILWRDFDPEVHRLLVMSNWLRTVLWSLRGLVVLGILYEFIC